MKSSIERQFRHWYLLLITGVIFTIPEHLGFLYPIFILTLAWDISIGFVTNYFRNSLQYFNQHLK